jgi:phenylpropionate dioxygenase-like ring-hydroxylating dioxygenase large terminal subunit
MILNQWYVILCSKEIRKNQVIGTRRLGENLVVWRDSQGTPGAARDKCPHRGIKLSLGKIKDDHLQCPFHGFEYDQHGECRLIPANGKASIIPNHIRASAYTLKEANGFIYLWYSETPCQDVSLLPPLPWFDNLDTSLVWSGMTDHWKAHYSRAIENQLDVVHVPFIHHTTIGRGIGPVVNGPYTEVTENSISFWPSNEQDKGQTPISPLHMIKPEKSTYITFIFPNLWQNHIMDSMRIVVAFAPVDDNNTIFYLRIYQKMVKIPLLKELYFILTKIFNIIVLHQDRRVVETHQPQETSLRMNENLVSGDYPIVQYRKKREELKKMTNYQLPINQDYHNR